MWVPERPTTAHDRCVAVVQQRSDGTVVRATSARLGLGLAVLGAASAMAVHAAVPVVSAHVVAVVLGVVIGNVAIGNAPLGAIAAPGLRLAGRHLLRAGVVLLGLRIAIGDVAGLGPALLVAVVAVVVITFTVTRALGRALGLSPGFSLLVATGWSICGASAIAAAEPLSGADEEEVAYAVALVALCGSLAIAVLPALDLLFGLSDPAFGAWVGASVHDVGQVVATASTHGDDAVAAAVVVKLTRVALLAPLLAVVAIGLRARMGKTTGGTASTGGMARPAIVPAFVVGFFVAVAVRSTGVLPDAALSAARSLLPLWPAFFFTPASPWWATAAARPRELGPRRDPRPPRRRAHDLSGSRHPADLGGGARQGRFRPPRMGCRAPCRGHRTCSREDGVCEEFKR
jgi:uncharacterized integral membrane protein (TIGR00698 family)